MSDQHITSGEHTISGQTATFDSHASPRALSSPRVWIPLTAAGAAMAAWRPRRPMVDRTERVHMEAPPDAVWGYLSDFENHWEPSNPDHAGTQVLCAPRQPLRDGLRFEQTERVGGITGDLDATLHDVIPQEQFCWRAEAVYRVAGLRLTVDVDGSGLRLALVDQIVQWHRGCIQVESAPEAGTTIATYLPLSS